jgi:hypothetical protein
VIERLQRAPVVLSDDSDVTNCLIRLYMFQNGIEYCKAAFGDLVSTIASSTEELGMNVIRDDLEREKLRTTKLDNLERSFVNRMNHSVASMPRSLRALVFVVGKQSGAAGVKRLMLERFFIPVISAAVEFGLVDSSTSEGRVTLVSCARMLQLACRKENNAALDAFVAEVVKGDYSKETCEEDQFRSLELEDTDMSFFVAAVADCEGAAEKLREEGVAVDEQLAKQFSQTVVLPLEEVWFVFVVLFLLF